MQRLEELERIVTKLRDDTSDENRDFIYMRRKEAKAVCDRLNFLEEVIAEILRSTYGKTTKPNAVA